MHFGEEERCQNAKLETYTRSLLQRKQIAGEVQLIVCTSKLELSLNDQDGYGILTGCDR